MVKTVLAGALLVGLAVPAFAQTSYYIVQDVKTKHCRIMDQKPSSTEWTVVGDNGVVYHTRTEAESAMKTVKVCTSD